MTKRTGGERKTATSNRGPKSARKPPARPRARPGTFPIVGIGASAGGLEALEELFKHMPADTGMAFVVVTHQHPGHTSLLPQLLGKCTRMPVVEARDGLRPAPNCIYLSHPGDYLALERGVLRLTEFKEPAGLRLPIDLFFRTLAGERRERAIGIVLSGTGSDGTLGLKAIKGVTGMVMAQDPQSAKYAGMPESAMDTGLVDYVLAPGQMPRQLVSYVRGPYLAPIETGTPAETALPEAMQKILILLRARLGHDFSSYKPSTIRRRIERRMNVHQINGPQQYLRYLRENPHELDLLFKELLIGVTSFFRDGEAFAALVKKALPELLKSVADAAQLRVWVPGCSTGEEAYSLAMVLTELTERLGRHLNIQIFATDLDPEAIDVARAGVYPDGIVVDVPRQRLTRFFVKEDGTYRIRKEIRDLVVFAIQNVTKDPPFTKLDLLSCRNLLIYLKGDMQKRLLTLFHYALKPHGVLFLGPSETIGGDFTQHYSTVDKKWKLFARKEAALPSPALAEFRTEPVTTVTAAGRADERTAAGRIREPHLINLLEKHLLKRFAPASVIVNERGDITYIHGRTGEYLEPSVGQPRLNILEMAREGLRLHLAAALRRAATQDGEVTQDGVRVRTNGGFHLVDVAVTRLTEPESVRGLLLVIFRPTPPSPAAPAPARRKQAASKNLVRQERELERELQATRESLQSAIEELEASNEELKSTNEELQSTNEELQSTNEELETSKEEMQSLNEELQTVNAQLQSKVEELSQANDDMQNLLNSTSIATLFLDRELNIKRFTEQARTVINLIPSDVGRPVADLVSNLNYGELTADAEEVLRTLASKEREVQTRQGDWRLVRILPYRTTNHVIDGLVITFLDINRLKRAERAADQARAFEASIVDTVREPMLVLDHQLRVIIASRSFCHFFQLKKAEVENRPVFELAGHAWDIPRLRTLLQNLLAKDGSFEDFEVDHEFPGIGRRRLRLNARRLGHDAHPPEMILLAMEDVTDRGQKLPGGKAAPDAPGRQP